MITLEYSIIYSKRRTISLQVKNDASVVVRAPFDYNKELIDRFVSSHIDWISKKLDIVKSKPKIDYLTDKQVKELKISVKEIITPIIAHYSKILNVFPRRVSINTAKTRFGSCSSNGNLNFSCRLGLYPHEAIEYVCVHELAHLKEMNHSPKFWAIVESVLPDYKERKKLLK